MAYIYESITGGVFNFTIPGTDKTVQLFRGSKVTVDVKLPMAYQRVLKLVGETEVKEIKVDTEVKPLATVNDNLILVTESPVEESPVEESPVEESPVEESPVEEREIKEIKTGSRRKK